VIDHSASALRKRGAFVPASSVRRHDAPAAATFAARHFAAKRAGFLLREYARQRDNPGEALPELAVITPGNAFGDESFEFEPIGDGPIEIVAIEDNSAGPSTEEIEQRIAEAEQRGRELAQAELAAALDQAMAALDAAGRAIAETNADLERRLVVPLAQASFNIGSELARQVLADGEGLQRYLAAVSAAVNPQGTEPASTNGIAALEVRLNPEDLAVLELASIRPSSLRLVADPLVPRAGVIATGGDKVVDDRLENRLREMREAVLSAAADLLREAPA
jgi:flagellar assembly protein FliH